MDKQAEIKKAVDSMVKAFNPIISEIVTRFESMLDNDTQIEKETVPLNILIEKSTTNGIKEISISLSLTDEEGYVLHKTTEFINQN